jgi:predicted RNA-binding protein with TRAM domain
MERRFSRPRFGERDFEGDFEKPVKIGETYDVEINEVGSRGDGIARVKNFVVFVSDTKKGEKCKIKITQVRRRFATGEKVGGGKEKKEEVEEAPEKEAEEEDVEEELEGETEEETEEDVEEEGE